MLNFKTSFLLTALTGLVAGSVFAACQPAAPLPPCTDGVDCVYSFKCNNEGGNTYWETAGGVVESTTETFFDLCKVVDPNAPGWEDEVRAGCTELCQYLHNEFLDPTLYPAICLDANWITVEKRYDSAGALARCSKETYGLNLASVGTALGALAQSYAETLPCDLGSNCMDYLTHEAKKGFIHSGMSGLELTADVQGVIPPPTAPGTPSTVTLMGTTSFISGAAAWSTTQCAEDACPFYLAQMDLAASSSMTVNVTYESTRLQKTVSDASVSLDHATMGMWLPSTGDVIFPPGSLYVRIIGTVSGTTQPFNENGNYDLVYPITEFVFGTLDNGVLEISHSDQDLLGSWSFTARFI